MTISPETSTCLTWSQAWLDDRLSGHGYRRQLSVAWGDDLGGWEGEPKHCGRFLLEEL